MGSRRLLAPPDRGGRFQSVYLGHLHIHQEQIKILLLRGCHGLASVRGDHHPVSPLLQKPDSQTLVYRVVLGHENAKNPRSKSGFAERSVCRLVILRLSGWQRRIARHAKADREVKRAPLIRLALDPNAAAHHLDELGANSQAQTGAAVPARGRPVSLRKRLENQRLLELGRLVIGNARKFREQAARAQRRLQVTQQFGT